MFKDYLCHISNTIFGMYQRPYSKEWDVILNQMLDEGALFSARQHYAEFLHEGQLFQVWTENRWYSYAHLYNHSNEHVERELQFRPRFSTMRRLHQATEAMKRDSLERRHQEIYLPASKEKAQ